MRERVSRKLTFSKLNQFTTYRIFEGNRCIAFNGICAFNAWPLSPPLRGLQWHLKSAKTFKPIFLSFFDLLHPRYSQVGMPKFGSRLTMIFVAIKPQLGALGQAAPFVRLPDYIYAAYKAPTLSPGTQTRSPTRSIPILDDRFGRIPRDQQPLPT
jgi:hypothetical protein